jgi:hypothetical protein
MSIGHIAGVPVEEALPGLLAPIAVYLAAGGIALRAARKRLTGAEEAKSAPRRPEK